MAATFRYGAEQVVYALRQAGGIQAAAAQALGCNRNTIANYARRYETVRAALLESRETLVDVAEGQLRRKVTAGEWPAIHFVLTTLGRARGYEPVTRQHVEHAGADGAPLVIRIEYGEGAEDDAGSGYPAS